jgi:hypothetical protein
VILKPDPLQARQRSGGGLRGDVKGFSAASRRRLLSLLNSIPEAYLTRALFVTLTYPEVYPSVNQARRHLDTFCKRLLRKWPRASVIWRIELQKRGAPHFHLIVLGVGFLPHQECAAMWYEVVGSRDTRHLAAGTQVRRVRSFRSVLGYASKYLSKVSKSAEELELPGRQWGIAGRQALPILLATLAISQEGFHQVRRTLRTQIERKAGRKFYAWRLRHIGMVAYFSSSDALRLAAEYIDCTAVPLD